MWTPPTGWAAADVPAQARGQNPLLDQGREGPERERRPLLQAAPVQHRPVIARHPLRPAAQAALIVGAGGADLVRLRRQPDGALRRQGCQGGRHVGGESAAVAVACEVGQAHAVVGPQGQRFI